LKDRVEKEGLPIKHCPTTAMLANVLTKPLQGNLFRRFRDVLLGYSHTKTLDEVTRNVYGPEERVGSNEPGPYTSGNEPKHNKGKELGWTLVERKRMHDNVSGTKNLHLRCVRKLRMHRIT
jgi:hypothetical protein